MKKNYKDYLIIIGSLLFLYFSLTNNKLINSSIINSISLFVKKVFPSLFPMIMINNILLDYNFSYYISKIFKEKGIKYYTMLLSIISGSPSNAIIIKELYKNKTIDNAMANNLLTFTYFASPIFLITMLSTIFNYKTTIKLILITYISNFIISIFIPFNKINPNLKKNENPSFSISISKTMNTLLMILGTITFFILLSTFLINIFNLDPINQVFIKGFLELTQGLNSLTIINNIKLKEIIAVMFISFGGLSIHMQIKSILKDTNLSYKYFLFGRLLSMIISVLITITRYSLF